MERKKTPSDFSNEYTSKRVRVKLPDTTIEGILLEASRYWLKVRSEKLYYINKAWVMYIEPVENKESR